MFESDDDMFTDLFDDFSNELDFTEGHETQITKDAGPLQRRHVINDTGEACLRSVKITGHTNVTCPIPVTTVEVTSSIFRCKDGEGKTRDKIAREKETVQHIWSRESKRIWLKTVTKNGSRKDVLHSRPRKSIMSHGREVETSVLEVQVQQFGEFGPQDTRSRCFFTPFGLVKDSKEETGVWISTKYYSEVMIPKVVSLGFDEKDTRRILKRLLNSGEPENEGDEKEEEEEKEKEEKEEEEKEIIQGTELIQLVPIVPQQPQFQVQQMWNSFCYPVWFLPDIK